MCQAYAAAQTALVAGDEAEARACLERRQELRTQLTKAQSERADAVGRVTRMEGAVAALTPASPARPDACSVGSAQANHRLRVAGSGRAPLPQRA